MRCMVPDCIRLADRANGLCHVCNAKRQNEESNHLILIGNGDLTYTCTMCDILVRNPWSHTCEN